ESRPRPADPLAARPRQVRRAPPEPRRLCRAALGAGRARGVHRPAHRRSAHRRRRREGAPDAGPPAAPTPRRPRASRPRPSRPDTGDPRRPRERVRQAGEEWPDVMKIKVINPNTTESMTEKIGAAARGVAAKGTTIVATSPAMGPVSIEGHYDEAVSVLGLLEEIRKGEADGCAG